MNGSRIERRIGILWNAGSGHGREVSFDLRVSDVRPVPVDANQRGSNRLAERVVRILPARSSGLRDLFFTRFLCVQRIDFRESHTEPAAAGKQRGQVGRIDLRQVGEHIDQTAQSSRDRAVHPFPHHGLRLGIALFISLVVQDLYQSDLRMVEPLHNAQRMIVAALIHFMALEGRPNEDRDDELPLVTRHLHHGKHRARTRAFPACADDDHD